MNSALVHRSLAPGAIVSSTIRRFSSTVRQRRLRSARPPTSSESATMLRSIQASSTDQSTTSRRPPTKHLPFSCSRVTGNSEAIQPDRLVVPVKFPPWPNSGNPFTTHNRALVS
jgi:hypothetical protein